MRFRRVKPMGRRGVAALTAVSIVALIGIGSLAVDLAMLIKVRAEAQRAADAASLAGASAFVDNIDPQDAIDPAFVRAMEYAGLNHLQGGEIDTTGGAGRVGLFDDRNEVRVQVIPDSAKVRVWVHRSGIRTFLARVLGITVWDVGAKAAAEAANAGSNETCVKPFLIPDYWSETEPTEDPAYDEIWDLPDLPGRKAECGDPGLECWTYVEGDDPYYQFGDSTVANSQWTGFGSDWRNGRANSSGVMYDKDVGRRFIMYPGTPQLDPVPSNYYLWRITCPGGDCVREALAGCVQTADIGEAIAPEQPGNVQGPVSQGIDDWMSQDESAQWVPKLVNGVDQGSVQSANANMQGYANPRVFVAAIMHPRFMAPGYDEVPISNLARFFLEDGPRAPGDHKPVIARFLGPAPGLGPENPDLGTLVRVPRLVE